MKRSKFQALLKDCPWLVPLFAHFYLEERWGQKNLQERFAHERKANRWNAEKNPHIVEKPFDSLDMAAQTRQFGPVDVGDISTGQNCRKQITATLAETLYFVGEKDPWGSGDITQLSASFTSTENLVCKHLTLEQRWKLWGFVLPRAIVQRVDAKMESLCQSTSIVIYRFPAMEVKLERRIGTF
jgi:hypothetical protein